jgi:hypothetical protein
MANMTGRSTWLRSVLLIAVVYVVVGIVTAQLAASASSIQVRNFWRLTAWALSLLVFLGHVAQERLRAGSTAMKAALHAAGAVALGAFVLAAVGPVRGYWDAPNFWGVAVLSLALWPILTGIPAFLVALVAGSILGRVVAGPNEDLS